MIMKKQSFCEKNHCCTYMQYIHIFKKNSIFLKSFTEKKHKKIKKMLVPEFIFNSLFLPINLIQTTIKTSAIFVTRGLLVCCKLQKWLVTKVSWHHDVRKDLGFVWIILLNTAGLRDTFLWLEWYKQWYDDSFKSLGYLDLRSHFHRLWRTNSHVIWILRDERQIGIVGEYIEGLYSIAAKWFL